MKNNIIIFIVVLMIVPVLGVQAQTRTHSVWIWQETGDCLWNIAKTYYGDPHKWKLIYEANKHFIDDPRVIYPKQVLEIPPLDYIPEAPRQESTQLPAPAVEELLEDEGMYLDTDTIEDVEEFEEIPDIEQVLDNNEEEDFFE